MKRFWLMVGIIVMLTCVLLMNIYSLPMHDELSYAFGGQSTPLVGECPRVHSLMDIVRQQWADYRANGNGRVIIHGLAAFFSGFRLYFLFDVLNTVVWAAFVWLLMIEGRLRVTLHSYFVCFCFAFWFLWYAESCSMNAVFALNYLWCPALTVAMMSAWRHFADKLWFMPLCFLFGWSQDASVLPYICAIGGSVVIKVLIKKQFSFSFQKVLNFVALVIGCTFLCLSPASLSRVGSTVGGGLIGILKTAVSTMPSFLLYGAPPLLLVLLLIVVVKQRDRLVSVLLDDMEWWLYFLSAFGLYFLCSSIPGVRLMMPWLTAGTILIFRYHKAIHLNANAGRVLCVIAIMWMVFATCCQIRIGIDNKRMLATYCGDDQGITYRENIAAPGYAISRGVFNEWHLSLFAREFNKRVPPVFFTKWIYDNLYQHPEVYFSGAHSLPGAPDVFVNDSCRYITIKKGSGMFTEVERRSSNKYLNMHKRSQPVWVPGRIMFMYPEEHELLIPMINEFSYVAKDANHYSIYCGGFYEPKCLSKWELFE